MATGLAIQGLVYGRGQVGKGQVNLIRALRCLILYGTGLPVKTFRGTMIRQAQQTIQHPASLLALLLQSQIRKIFAQTLCALLRLDVDLGLV